jgi:hypothetical protein
MASHGCGLAACGADRIAAIQQGASRNAASQPLAVRPCLGCPPPLLLLPWPASLSLSLSLTDFAPPPLAFVVGVGEYRLPKRYARNSWEYCLRAACGSPSPRWKPCCGRSSP